MRITGIQQLEQTARTTIAEVHRGASASGEEVEVTVVDAAAWASPGVAERVRKAAALQALELRRPLALESMQDGRLAIVTEVRRPVGLLLREQTPLTPNDAATITHGIAKALQAVHAAGLVHGRVDPTSVRVGGGPPAWLPELAGLTEAQVPGEPPTTWAAPEVVAGMPPGPGADVYSLGRLLLALLHGDVDVAPDTPPPAKAAYFGNVLRSCLAPTAELRYPTAQHVLKALGLVNATFVGPPRVPSQELPAVPAPPSPGEAPEAEVLEMQLVPVGLGPWELETLLGEGAMGQVYRARHKTLGRRAAIKLLRPELYRSPELVQRFFQEATTVNRINHEHIVQITDFVQEDGPHGPKAVYCVMELLEGESLSTRLSRAPLAIVRAVHIARQVCDALGAAHAVGIVHRDVKTENVLLLTRGGDPDYVKVLDFGVAKLLGGEGKGPMVSTMDGAIIGTPSAMAPEQAAGSEVDHRIDVYATGVLLYEMLTGRVPFDEGNFAALVVKIMSAPPPPLPPQTPRGEPIPPALAAVVLQCLAKTPQERPQSMAELSAALAQALTPGAEPRPLPTPAKPAPSPAPVETPEALAMPPSRRGLVAGLLVLVAALGAGLWFAGRGDESGAAVTPPVPPTPVAVVAPPPAADEVDAGEARADDAGAEDQVEPDAGIEAPQDAGVRPKVALPPPVTLTSEHILSVMRRATGLGACIKRHQASLTAKQGAILIAFTVEPSGKVGTVAIDESQFKGKQLGACLTSAMKALRFPRHVGPAAKSAKIPYTYDIRAD